MSALPRNQILVGSALAHLRELPDASVDCVVTSPPYYGLRDYEIDGQIGHETSISEWVAALLEITAELARVLKRSGTFWLNVDDTYSRHRNDGAPPKAMLLGPERLLLGLDDQGWIVRSKVVWAKPYAMPDPARDRLTGTWEPVYLLVRSRRYHFDLDPIREPHKTPRRRPRSQRGPEPRGPGRNIPQWAGPRAGDQSGLARYKALGMPGHPLGKNPGDVWTIPQNNPRGVHHATYPAALIERPITAGCPAKVCSHCGRPWTRPTVGTWATEPADLAPGCRCDAPPAPGVVLDPFLGSGTTAVVAERLGRDWLGIELNPDFANVARQHITKARHPDDTPA